MAEHVEADEDQRCLLMAAFWWIGVAAELQEAASKKKKFDISFHPSSLYPPLSSSLSLSLLMHDLPLCGMWKGSRCHGNPKP